MSDIAIIGAGHNGLVCACYLAKAGHKVRVFEKSSYIGGGCRNERWASGAIISPAANHYGMFSPIVARELELDLNDLKIVRANPSLIVGLGPGESIALCNSLNETKREIGRFSKKDSESYVEFEQDLELVRKVVNDVVHNPHASLEEFSKTLKEHKEYLPERFIYSSMAETICSYFSTREVQAAFAATTILYNAAPNAPGTAFALAYLSLSQISGTPGWGIPVGGMGQLPRMLEAKARSLGVQIAMQTSIDKIITRGQQAVGLRLHSGEFIAADIIASSADPYTTFISLAGLSEQALPNWREEAFGGPCAKFNFTFRGRVNPNALKVSHKVKLKNTVYILMPSLDFMNRAFKDSSARGYSPNPYLEFLCPSDFDPRLAPSGLRIGSIYLMFASYSRLLKQSLSDRQKLKEDAFRRALEVVGIDEVVEQELLDPIDLQEKFGFHLGNVDHGAQVLSNLFQHRGQQFGEKIGNLFICGSGTHPGGLVSGIPGRNAAIRILEEDK